MNLTFAALIQPNLIICFAEHNIINMLYNTCVSAQTTQLFMRLGRLHEYSNAVSVGLRLILSEIMVVKSILYIIWSLCMFKLQLITLDVDRGFLWMQ